MEQILVILTSAIVSCAVSYVTVKCCFGKIDTYVKDMTDELHDALNKFMDYCLKNK